MYNRDRNFTTTTTIADMKCMLSHLHTVKVQVEFKNEQEKLKQLDLFR